MGLSSTDEEEAELMPLIQPKVEILEEADANSLGLNVIWVDDDGEIPGVLERIGPESRSGAVRPSAPPSPARSSPDKRGEISG